MVDSSHTLLIVIVADFSRYCLLVVGSLYTARIEISSQGFIQFWSIWSRLGQVGVASNSVEQWETTHVEDYDRDTYGMNVYLVRNIYLVDT